MQSEPALAMQLSWLLRLLGVAASAENLPQTK
jgi:hypothetical protein